MIPGRVVVVGLGPAGTGLILPAARAALERIPCRFVRTARHPAVRELRAEGLEFPGFDHLYESGRSLDDVYASIAAAVVAAARDRGEVAYAVPGNPAVAEQTVSLLHEAAARGDVELEVVPGLSFVDLAWSRLGIDPLGGVALVDGRRFALDAAGRAGRMLVAQCDSPLVLSDVKLALLETLGPESPVTILRRLGGPDEHVATVPLADLDRTGEPDHLTSLYVDTGTRPVAPELARLLALAERLRAPGGCPWDAEQTHHSVRRYLLEEAYEVVEAIERLPSEAPAGAPDLDAYAALADELGDLLYQVLFHAVLAREAGAFTMVDVATGIHDKLVRRHPHVFGAVEARTADAVMRNWEQIKRDEKGAASLVEGITPGLPSLLYAHKLLRKAAAVGLEPGSVAAAAARVRGAADRLAASAGPARDAAEVEEALGELLAAAVVIARALGTDAESALRGWAARFRERFGAMERLAGDRGADLAGLAPAQVAELWREAASGLDHTR